MRKQLSQNEVHIKRSSACGSLPGQFLVEGTEGLAGPPMICLFVSYVAVKESRKSFTIPFYPPALPTLKLHSPSSFEVQNELNKSPMPQQ